MDRRSPSRIASVFSFWIGLVRSFPSSQERERVSQEECLRAAEQRLAAAHAEVEGLRARPPPPAEGTAVTAVDTRQVPSHCARTPCGSQSLEVATSSMPR